MFQGDEVDPVAPFGVLSALVAPVLHHQRQSSEG